MRFISALVVFLVDILNNSLFLWLGGLIILYFAIALFFSLFKRSKYK